MYVSSVCGPSALQEGDVLLAFDGNALDNLGFTQVLEQRLLFYALRDLCTVGQQVNLTVWRNGQEQTIQHTMGGARNLVPDGQYDVEPPFFICGGLVFQPLSREYLESMQHPPSHLEDLMYEGKQNETQEVVVLTMILEDRINRGFGSGYIGGPVIRTLNGQPIENVKHLVQAVQEARSSGVNFLKFGSHELQFVLPTAGLDSADKRIELVYKAPTSSHHYVEDLSLPSNL